MIRLLGLGTTRSFIDGCEQRDPLSVEFVLDVNRGLDITGVHELLDCTEYFLLVDVEALHLGSHPPQLLILLVEARMDLNFETVSSRELRIDLHYKVIELGHHFLFKLSFYRYEPAVDCLPLPLGGLVIIEDALLNPASFVNKLLFPCLEVLALRLS